MIYENEYKPHMTFEQLENTKAYKHFYKVFYKMVPLIGLAKTVAGEKMRKVNRNIYRYYNDGDFPRMLIRYGISGYEAQHGYDTVPAAFYLLINDTLEQVMKTTAYKVATKGMDLNFD